MAVYRCNMGIRNSQATEDGLKAQALWVAVLMRAIKDMYLTREKTARARAIAKMARVKLQRWFADDSKEVCSFRWMCSACHVPASKIRRALADGSAKKMLSENKT